MNVSRRFADMPTVRVRPLRRAEYDLLVEQDAFAPWPTRPSNSTTAPRRGSNAEAEVQEYWVIDVGRGVVHVHTGPAPGGYGSVVRRGRDEALEILGVSLTLRQLTP